MYGHFAHSHARRALAGRCSPRLAPIAGKCLFFPAITLQLQVPASSGACQLALLVTQLRRSSRVFADCCNSCCPLTLRKKEDSSGGLTFWGAIPRRLRPGNQLRGPTAMRSGFDGTTAGNPQGACREPTGDPQGTTGNQREPTGNPRGKEFPAE